jgi:hypothetical protein
MDKQIALKLRKFSTAFKEARDREANESDTVMFLVKFFEEVLGYDSLAGEISKEVSIKERFCDLAIKTSGQTRYLVEVKASGNKLLRHKDIEQAENYAARMGIKWVLLTNGVEWNLYHLTFNEGEGITNELAFGVNLVDKFEENIEKIWSALTCIAKDYVAADRLNEFWAQKKALSPSSLVHILFSEPVLTILRRELNRVSEVRLELPDVYAAVRDVVSKEALMAAGDLGLPKKKRKKRRRRLVDSINPDSGAHEDIEDDETSDEEDTEESDTESGSEKEGIVPG